MPVDKNGKDILTSIDFAIAGGVSGAVTRGLCQPLDVLKIRFQLQIEPLRQHAGVKYWSLTQASRQIVTEEGVKALWKGHVPAQLLSIFYGVAQFASFELISNVAPRALPLSVIPFVAGAAAGGVATLFSFPCDMVRTRLVAQGEPKIYSGVYQAVYQIYTQEGARAFYKGLSPTLIQVVPHTGAQFAFYAAFKNIWKLLVGEGNISTNSAVIPVSLSGSLICGSLSGVCAKTVIYPFDLARKRLQVQGFEEARRKFGKVFKCSGLFNCIWETVKEERVRGLFKGLSPSLLKAAATTALHFCVYEQTCLMLALFHNSRLRS